MSKTPGRAHGSKDSRESRQRSPRPPLSGGAKAALILIGLFLAFAVAGLLELGLRAARYGPDLRVFKERTLLGRQVREFNRDISLRYFPKEMAKQPGFERFAAVKSSDTYRIFSLGESSTAGDPYGPQASFTAFLKNMLEDVHPEKTWEVVNCGIVAISSADVLDLLPEILDQKPDALLLYVGHNEAYGADAVLSGLRGTVTSRAWMKFRIQTRRLRLSFLAQEVMRKFRGGKPGTTKEFGMDLMQGKVLPRSGGLHKTMLDIYRGNMGEIIRTARKRGVDVILCTPVSNLRDQSPFGSAHGTKISAAGSTGPEADAHRDVEARRWDAGLGKLDALIASDSTFAESRFLRARCFDALARPSVPGTPASIAYDRAAPVTDPARIEAARREYRAARDQDIVHFRECSDQIRVLHELVDSMRDPHVLLVDLERDLDAASPDGIPGRERMTEHVHPTIRGHAFLAESICRALSGSEVGRRMGSWDLSRLASTDAYMSRMGLDAVDEATGLLLTLRFKMTKWPFTQAVENRPAMENITREIQALTAGFDPISLQVFRETDAGRFLDGYDYGMRHQEIARRAMAAQQFSLALREFQKCVDLWGPQAELACNMAQGTLMLRDFAKTDSLCDLADRLDPGFARTHFVRGMLRREQGRVPEARSELQRYLQLEPATIFAGAARQILGQMRG